METDQRKNRFYGMSQEQLKKIAIDYINGSNDLAENKDEILSFLQLSSEALQSAKLTIEDVGFSMGQIIKIANGAYGGSKPEAMARHEIASNILSSFPRRGDSVRK